MILLKNKITLLLLVSLLGISFTTALSVQIANAQGALPEEPQLGPGEDIPAFRPTTQDPLVQPRQDPIVNPRQDPLIQGGGGGVTNPLNFSSIQQFFAKLLEFLVMLAVPFLIFMIIYTGFKFVMAQGNSEALAEARRMFLYTIIGGLLILGASIVAQIVKGTVDSVTTGMILDHVLQAAAPLFNF